MLFMKSQIFLFIKVALSGREAAERFSISLFLQSNWEPGSGADLFVFSFAMTRRRIPLSLSLTLSLSLSLLVSFTNPLAAGTCLYHCLWYNLDRCSPGKYHIVACMHQMFLWQMAFFCKKTNFFSGRFMLAAILCNSYHTLVLL